MVAASHDVAVAKGWRSSCMDRRMQKVEEESKFVAEALQCLAVAKTASQQAQDIMESALHLRVAFGCHLHSFENSCFI